MGDKRKYIKNPYAGKERKAVSGRGNLLNLIKARITTKGNGSMNMNMEKGGITMNITIMTVI